MPSTKITFLSYSSKKRANNAFYLTPLRIQRADCWYSVVPLGHNTLASTVKRLCEAAGIKELRATAATRLYEAKVDEQLI